MFAFAVAVNHLWNWTTGGLSFVTGGWGAGSGASACQVSLAPPISSQNTDPPARLCPPPPAPWASAGGGLRFEHTHIHTPSANPTFYTFGYQKLLCRLVQCATKSYFLPWL